ncbi:MAG: thrombospondin type 3 repeat-containing protein, partial [Myxococcales bacterium]|nr:thrombospondin type 3 repeat-containing protein [Myxococcales bacterium]
MSKSKNDDRGRWKIREVYGSSPIRLARDAAIVAALAGTGVALHGCVTDPDCGICDPDKLVLETISGVNYAGKTINFLGPRCSNDQGDAASCPEEGSLVEAEVYVEQIGPCEESDDALESERGAEEWCRISPMIVNSNIAFVFNNLLEATTIELVRKQMTNPQLFEVYDWKSRILEIKGPITRYNGDYENGVGENPDIMERAVNLSCIENLREFEGTAFDHTSDPAACDRTFTVDNGAVDDIKGFNSRDNEKLRNSHPGGVIPLRMEPFGHTKSYRGETDIRSSGNSCATPDNGPDTCCSACDFELSVNIAKYGIDAPGGDRGNQRIPGSTAFECDATAGDKFAECRDFVAWTDRSAEPRNYVYDWNGDAGPHKLPYQDKLREAHPDDRPAGSEQKTVPCTTNADCTSSNGAGLDGMECVGELGAGGPACDPDAHADDECVNARCVAEWVVDCTTFPYSGEQGYCVDRRFSDQGANGCINNGGRRVANYDDDEDGKISRDEAVAGGLCGAEGACDPYVLGGNPVGNYDRATTLPLEAQCKCDTDPAYVCRGIVARLCSEDGAANGTYDAAADEEVIADKEALVTACEESRAECCESVNCSDLPYVYTKDSDYDGEMCDEALTTCLEDANLIAERYPNLSTMVKAEEFTALDGIRRKGQFAQKFISKFGGVVYDPAIKGVQYRIADLGNVARSLLERCAAARPTSDTANLGNFSIKDGWRANDTFFEEFEDFDRGMCSSSTYTVRFAVPEDGESAEYIKDKVGNDLTEQNNYTFQTPNFHIIPDSGFPSDNLRIGACDEFEIRFSNKYDMSEQNLRKIQIVELVESGMDGDDVTYAEAGVVAGGFGCAENADQLDPGGGNVPCLTVNVKNQTTGAVSVFVDYNTFTEVVLKEGKRYRFKVPGLETYSDGSSIKWPLDLRDVTPEDYQAAFWDVCGMPLVLGKNTTDWQYDFTIDPAKCKEDKDGDGIPFSCDNAPDTTNPDQNDGDKDGFGDAEDLCVVTPQDQNTADSDRDGVGNTCDNCKERPSNVYNKGAAEAGIPAYLLVRNIPFQDDWDFDGIGDVCDNCVKGANCFDFDQDNPYTVGTPLDTDDTNACQKAPADPMDETWKWIGDACFEGGVPIELQGAAGPVGFGNNDDFDQDGIVNVQDKCPRQPVEGVACSDNTECGPDTACTGGICNHVDSDGDNVGNECDTCPGLPNPSQVMDGGMQDDDEDEDFVGSICETNSACANRPDPRPYGTFDVSVNGVCCTVAFDPTRMLTDPDGRLLTVDCPEGDTTCRKLPDVLS